MTRWAFVLTVVVIVLGSAAVWTARLFGRSGSRASVLVSVVSAWLAAYVLWTFAGGLAMRYGLVDTYNGALFGMLALLGGTWQYRTHLRRGREHGLTIFVGAQLLWLVIVMVQNGVLQP